MRHGSLGLPQGICISRWFPRAPGCPAPSLRWLPTPRQARLHLCLQGWSYPWDTEEANFWPPRRDAQRGVLPMGHEPSLSHCCVPEQQAWVTW